MIEQVAPLGSELHAVLAASGTGTWHWDASTGTVHWDETLEALAGLDPGTFGSTFEAWLATLHPDEVAGILAQVNEAIDRRGSYHFEHRALWPDGSVHWLECRGQVTTDGDGNFTGTVGCAFDITDRRRAEEASAAALQRERRLRDRIEFLVSLTDIAGSVKDHEEAMRATANAAVPRLGEWCSIHFLPEPAAEMEVVVAHIEPQKAAWADELARRVPFDPDGDDGVSAVVRTGRTEFIPCVPGEMIDAAMHRSVLAPSELEEVLSNLSLASVITAPLVTKRGVVGAMRFVSGDPGRTYDADDVALAEAAASRVADMLDNIWLTEQHRHISETLQRALLPPALPCIPGIDVAVRYWPAGTAVEAGGDFYDVFQTAPTRWSVLIGDVCGTGPDAAALTGIARHTVRAAARHGLDHRAILQWVNEAMRHSGRDRFCTAVYAELGLDEGGWTISTAAAGHPRPVLVRSTGGAELLGRPGSLLGVFEDIDLTVTDVSLDPGDVVICYTDGITDLPPPGGQTEHDVAELAARVAPGRSAAQIAEEIHDSVREQLRHDERSDDVALVVLRVC